MGETSKQLFEGSKQRKYKDLYEALVSRDPEQRLRFTTLSLTGLEEELAEFLRPMIAYLKETRTTLDFEAFSAALDYQRQHSATPTAHLFVQRSKTRTSDRYRQEVEGEVFTPRTDPNSNKIASRHRPRGSTPLHEQLLREKELWESKLQEQRLLQEERTLQECTFQPNYTGRASSTERSVGHTPRTPRENLHESNSDPLLCGRAIRLGGVMLAESTATSAPSNKNAAGASEPIDDGQPSRTGTHPVAHVINSLESARDRAFVEGILQSYGSEVLSLNPCKTQIDEAEQAVAQCKTLLATSA